MSEQVTTTDLLKNALESARNRRTVERSESQRLLAILVTEIEKVVALSQYVTTHEISEGRY